MKIKHTKKVSGFAYKPDDETEPDLGTEVEVPDAVGIALIQRGWGEDVAGKVVIERRSKRMTLEQVQRLRGNPTVALFDGRYGVLIHSGEAEGEVQIENVNEKGESVSERVSIPWERLSDQGGYLEELEDLEDISVEALAESLIEPAEEGSNL